MTQRDLKLLLAIFIKLTARSNHMTVRYDKEAGDHMKHLMVRVNSTTRHGEMLKYWCM